MGSTSFTRWILGLLPAALCATAVLQGMAGSATAQDKPPADRPPADRPPAEWSFSVGGAGIYTPDYEGSNDYKVMPVPLVELSWRDRVRLTTKGGPGIYATPFAMNGMKMDLGIRYDFGRDADDNNALKGLGDIKGGAVAVARFGYEIRPLDLSLEVARDLGGDRDGLLATAKAEYSVKGLFNSRVRVGITPHISWADDNYMGNTFGITAAQAARSARHYAKYDASGGFKDAGLAVGIGYAATDSILVMGRLDYSRLLGDAADSPLVKQEGSADQFSALLGVSYRW